MFTYLFRKIGFGIPVINLTIASLILYFAFICWIIIEADRGELNFFIENVRSIPYGDKIGHVIIYALLAFLLSITLSGTSKRLTATFFKLPVGCLIVLVFAFIEELTQVFFATRTLDVGDIAADVIGVYVASVVLSIRNRKQ